MSNTNNAIQLAIAEYKKSDKNGKGLLERVFGKDVFTPDVKGKVPSVEEACKIIGVNYADKFSAEVLALLEPHELAFRKLNYVYEAVNKLCGFVADYTNPNQNKYFPYYSGSAFSGVDNAFTFTYSRVGARLVVESGELAIWIGTQYMEEHHIMLGLKNFKNVA